jgi:S-adenosylmethionine:tRNA ribosyltransferase-isomerase
MRTDELDYPLDESLVATHPAEPRESARLMVVSRASGEVEHATVGDLPRFLRAGDATVVNATRVIPARIKARRATGARIDGLLVEPRSELGAGGWFALLRNAKKTGPGERLSLETPMPTGEASLEIVAREAEGYLVRLGAAVEAVGWTPLPPYILKARGQGGEAESATAEARDRRDYQTSFAVAAPRLGGSVAAPTAGLHLTGSLRTELAARGVGEIPVELEVGLGTFKPVETERIEDHPMHRERCLVPTTSRVALADALAARAAGRGRIVAGGTTSVRTLESMPDADAAPGGDLAWDTRLLITPGFRFRRVDAILTNFHLPRSTLLALVAAFLSEDPARAVERLHELYSIARRERYRHYSFGDAMLVLP